MRIMKKIGVIVLIVLAASFGFNRYHYYHVKVHEAPPAVEMSEVRQGGSLVL